MQGMIGILSGLLGVKQQPETLVRALMALAMLLGNNPAGLLEISDSKRAVENLAIIMRNSKDEDSKLVATTIFSNLVGPRATACCEGRQCQRTERGI
jgi:hypothetical protein